MLDFAGASYIIQFLDNRYLHNDNVKLYIETDCFNFYFIKIQLSSMSSGIQ